MKVKFQVLSSATRNTWQSREQSAARADFASCAMERSIRGVAADVYSMPSAHPVEAIQSNVRVPPLPAAAAAAARRAAALPARAARERLPALRLAA